MVSRKEKVFHRLSVTASTVKATVLPISDTISDLYLINAYHSKGELSRSLTLLFVFLISQFISWAVIFYRITKRHEAAAVWRRPWKRVLFTIATFLTLGPVILKLVEIFGDENRLNGAKNPTCYCKLTLCFLECLPQFVINLFYICSDGCWSIEQMVSLAISVAAACYAVQRYTNPADERLSRPIENTVHTIWILCILVGNIAPFAIISGLVSPLFLLTGFFTIYSMTSLIMFRAILVNLVDGKPPKEERGPITKILHHLFIEESDHSEVLLKREYDLIFIIVTISTCIMQFSFLFAFLALILFGGFINTTLIVDMRTTIEGCPDFAIYKHPFILLSLSALMLSISYLFFFAIVLNDWPTVQKRVYNVLSFFHIVSPRGYDADEEAVAVPAGSRSEIGDVLRSLSSSEKKQDNPELKKRELRRMNSGYDSVLLFESVDKFNPNITFSFCNAPPNEESSSKEDGEMSSGGSHENSKPPPTPPRSPKSGNYRDSECTTELIFYKPRAATFFHDELDCKLEAIGEEEFID